MLSESLDDYVTDTNLVRVVNVFVDGKFNVLPSSVPVGCYRCLKAKRGAQH